MSNWTVRPLKPGDQIRVNRGAYWHHGIYLGGGRAAHFSGENDDGLSEPETVRVRETDIRDFTRGGFAEAREYGLAERLRLRRPDAIVQAARSRVGEGGYDILQNNCEHFSNECAFGAHESGQVDDVRQRVRRLLKKDER